VQVEVMEVYQEIKDMLGSRVGVSQFMCKPVTRHYCFEDESVPKEGEYLKVLFLVFIYSGFGGGFKK
jgi:hypothetical protein